jgi:hypothetical protein
MMICNMHIAYIYIYIYIYYNANNNVIIYIVVLQTGTPASVLANVTPIAEQETHKAIPKTPVTNIALGLVQPIRCCIY